MKISYPFNMRPFLPRANQEYSDLSHFEGSTRAFFNKYPSSYAAELLHSQQVGIFPIKKGTAEFDVWVSSGASMKWVYTVYRKLYIAVGVSGTASHAVIARGLPVYSAGMACWNNYTLEISAYTGHYQTSLYSLRSHAYEAWRDCGVNIRIVDWREQQATALEENSRMFAEAEILLRGNRLNRAGNPGDYPL